MNNEDDFRNVYNPEKKGNYWPSTFEDIRHDGRNGLAQTNKSWDIGDQAEY